jgi:hypothetical protein
MSSRVSKRRRTDPEASSSVQGELTRNLTSVKSVRELAEPFRICTAKFPIDALTPSWSLGINRPLNDKHVVSLCRTFEGPDGLQREASKNYLMVGCTGEQIQKMRFHFDLVYGTSSWLESVSGPWPSFHEWTTVSGQAAEIISGQHRVEALKMFLARNSRRLDLSENDERWWVCDIYNLGTLYYLQSCVSLLTFL